MRATISVPDELFESADELANELHVSRSWLYATAVAEYIARHRYADTTARLDEVYATEDGRLEPPLRRAQARSVVRESDGEASPG